MNIAKYDAIRFAEEKAKRLNISQKVYVAGPEAEAALTNTKGFNNWYVRNSDEPAPEEAELYQEIFP